jgi:hypothetical protein
MGMKRFFANFCMVLLACMISFIFGAVATVKNKWGSSAFIINVNNQSNKKIAVIEIYYTSCGLSRMVNQRADHIQGPLKSINRQQFEISLCGEGSHKTKVIFSDGQSVETRAGSYVQNGGSVTEIVTVTGIQSQFKQSLF